MLKGVFFFFYEEIQGTACFLACDNEVEGS